jgi:tetratricopeptide (TPR) repeat protein
VVSTQTGLTDAGSGVEETVTEPGPDLGLGGGTSFPQLRKAEEIIIARDPISALQGLGRKQLNELALVGHKLFERGKLSQARAVFEALVAVGMPEAFPYTMLGTVYLAQNNPSRALALFEAALRIDAKDIAARVYRGEIKAQSGKHKEALSDFDAVIKQGKKEDPFVQRARQLSRITSELARKRK